MYVTAKLGESKMQLNFKYKKTESGKYNIKLIINNQPDKELPENNCHIILCKSMASNKPNAYYSIPRISSIVDNEAFFLHHYLVNFPDVTVADIEEALSIFCEGEKIHLV